MKDQTLPPMAFGAFNAGSGWSPDVVFSPWTGLSELNAWHWVEAQNNTWIQIILSLNTHYLSSDLSAHLRDCPLDRLFLFFRQPHGHLLAASHGKHHSHSHLDLRRIDPTVTSPDVQSWKKFNCSNSTDILIAQCCQQLHARYGGWQEIPETSKEMILNGSRCVRCARVQ